MRGKIAPTAALLLAALAVPAGPGAAQSGQEIMERAAEAHEKRMEGIDEYTVTQQVDVMAAPVTRRFVKRTVDGRSVFVAASRDAEQPDTPAGWGNPYRLIPQVAGRAVLDGRASLDGGGEAWRISVDDFEGLDVSGMTPAGARGDFRPARATFLLDTESLAIRRVVMRGTMESEAGSGPVKIEARFDDYREIGGMLHPFRTEVSVEGMHSIIGEEGLAEARRRLEILQARRDSLTEAEKAMLPPVAARRLERLRNLVEEGRVDVTVEVRDLQVGPEGSGGAGGG